MSSLPALRPIEDDLAFLAYVLLRRENGHATVRELERLRLIAERHRPASTMTDPHNATP